MLGTIMSKVKTNSEDVNDLCEELSEGRHLTMELKLVFLFSLLFYFLLLWGLSHFQVAHNTMVMVGGGGLTAMVLAYSLMGSWALWKNELSHFLRCRFCGKNQGLYVMTIGVIDECRRLGLAT